MLAGIYSPSKGAIHINGKLTPFIELGVGFNMELTGRENVFLNGALLGFNRKEMNKMYDSIVEFAELERFMDQKLKNYSSGMQVRLAFSIAIRAESDILLIDEVLAVGDSSFQRKCFDVFEKYKANDKTVILVTHDMGTVRQFCNRAMLISDGDVLEIGQPLNIAGRYDKLNQENIDASTSKANKNSPQKALIRAELLDESGNLASSFQRGSYLNVSLKWPKSLPVTNLGVAIVKQSGELMFGSNTIEADTPRPDKKHYKATWRVNLNLGKGRYHLMYGGFGKNNVDVKHFVVEGPSFILVDNVDKGWDGMLYLDNSWKMDD
jgi:ABC-2 type transport system ATP-binding protein